jgi:hypothetical protein
MPRLFARAALASLLTAAIPASDALAHAVCGNRVFPPTLTLDDPGVNDELSLPTIQYAPITGGGSSASYGFEFDKTITPTLGVAIEGGYVVQHAPGANAQGWDNLAATLKDQVYCDEMHEFMISVGVERDFNNTGSGQLRRADAIESVSTTTPTVYAGKGLGDLPIGWARAFAVTGTFGYEISDRPGIGASQFDYAASLQYSIPYLNQHVTALNVPEFFTHLIPLVEVAMTTPQQGGTATGTVAPGIFYEAQAWQVGAEAIIPINRATREIQGTGFIVQFHLFLDDLLPNSLGRPLFP